MTKLMIVVGSVRPGRIGLPIAQWVREHAESVGGFEIDFADLAEINLPFMDEPKSPVKRQYTKPHTIAWSERVDAAEAIIFVTPEYNHSLSPALKNAIDFLYQEWWRKAVGIISYGGVSGGTRAAVALGVVVGTVGMVDTGANLEIPFASKQVVDGAFVATDRETGVLDRMLAELAPLATALAPIRSRG